MSAQQPETRVANWGDSLGPPRPRLGAWVYTRSRDGAVRELMPSFKTWAPEPAALTAKSVAERVTTYVLGTPDGRVRTVSAAIQAGFRFGVFVRLAETLGVAQGNLARFLGLSAGSLARRRKRGRFAAHESDRMWLLLRLYVRALDVHGSEGAAREWLRAPLPALGRRTALEVSTNSAGAQRSLEVLNQLQYGVFG